MIITADGNVGIGTTTPTSLLDIKSTNNYGENVAMLRLTRENIDIGPNSKTYIEIYYKQTQENNPPPNKPHCRFGLITDPNANVDSIPYEQMGNFFVELNNGYNVLTTPFYLKGDGSVSIPGSLTVASQHVPSDKRIKTDISEIKSEDFMSILRKLELKKYKYNKLYSHDKKQLTQDDYVYGWIAQEIKEIYPQAVTIQTTPLELKYNDKEEKIDDLHTLNKGKLYDMAVAGVKNVDSRLGNYEDILKIEKTKIGIYSMSDKTQELLEINQNGYLGIGRTNPETLLHLCLNNENKSEILRLENTNKNQGIKISLNQWSKKSNKIKEIGNISTEISTNRGTDLKISTEDQYSNVTEKMRITGKGNIGIGLSNPKGTIDINSKYIL